MSVLSESILRVGGFEARRVIGSVSGLRGLTVRASDLPAPLGALVRIGAEVDAEVIGFDERQAVLLPLTPPTGVRAGDRVALLEPTPCIGVGDRLRGRVIDGLGRAIDPHGPPRGLAWRAIRPEPINAMARRPIDTMLRTGVRAIDTMTPMGLGQRMGVFAGPGVGKSTLLGMIARRSSADVNVIAMIGERGREVREFIEDSLGEDGLARSVVVVSTSDESPVMRVRAAMAACTIAEYFRDQGKNVMFMLDSVTRFAHAQRQIGLASGEPPATKGYTPSVFAQLPILLERAGATEDRPGAKGGTITGIYTVLVEGDDMTEPISDAVRGILDGHLVLSRRLAQRGHFPAIDVLDSVSRVATRVAPEDLLTARAGALRLLSSYRDVEELLQIGAYPRGTNAETDAAIDAKPRLDSVLCQRVGEGEPFEVSKARLATITEEALAVVRNAAREAGAARNGKGQAAGRQGAKR